MIIHAYDEMYLDDAMDTLGDAVEYATLFCNIDGQEFIDLFMASGIASEFGRGNVKYISSMSEIELAILVLETCGKKKVPIWWNYHILIIRQNTGLGGYWHITSGIQVRFFLLYVKR